MAHATHSNAALTVRARLRLARLIIDDEWPIARAAERYDVSWKTAAKWARRYEAEGADGLLDRSSRPHHQPNKTPPHVVRKIVKTRLRQRLGPMGPDPGSWTRRIQHLVLGKRDDSRIMARKNYSEEFRRQAVDLYESTPGATVRGIAEDLGIVRGTLRHWLEVYGTGKKTAADGTLTSSPLQSKPSKSSSTPADETSEQKIARLEARVDELEVETTKLTIEREILQRAAKYFAGETRW